MCRSKMTFFQKLSYVDADFRRFLLASCVGVFSEQIFPRRIGRARLESANLEPDRRFGWISAVSPFRPEKMCRFRLRISAFRCVGVRISAFGGRRPCTGAQKVDFMKPVDSACVFGFETTAKKLACTGNPRFGVGRFFYTR